jgi:peptide/nickel transport system substrate-binding protein/oligopeptide transport system substrate-binding protein
MKRERKFTIGVLPALFCLVVAILVAGCSGGNTLPLATQKPSKAPGDQQVFRWRKGGDIATFDPALVLDTDSTNAIQMVFTGLVQLDDHLNVHGQMASTWDASPDGMTWTFHLRSGLTFSDDTPLSAHDVAYSIDRALQKSTQSPSALTYLRLIKEADKLNAGAIKTIINDSLLIPDDHTLIIRLSKPGAYFLYALTYPTSYPVEKRLIDRWGSQWTAHLTDGGGDGPFKVAAYSHQTGITFVPNPNYYGRQPQLRQVLFEFYSNDQTAYDTYETGQLDYTTVPAAYLVADGRKPDVHRVPLLNITYFQMNYLIKPFDDIKIRQAFALALDKDQIVHYLQKDQNIPTNHIVPQGQPGYNPNLAGPAGVVSTHGDPALARMLLLQGIRDEGWSSISQIPAIELTYSTDEQFISVVIQRWQTILGITVKANHIEAVQEYDQLAKTTNNKDGLQFWRISWSADYPDPQDWTTLQFGNGSPENFSNYGENQSTNAAEQMQVQQQLEAADLMQNPTVRYRAYNDLEQKLVDDVAWLPLWQENDVYRLKPYIVGFVENSIQEPPPDDWANIYIAAH